MGNDVKEQLCKLFRKGHSESSALHCLKTDLLIKHGDKYHEFTADGRYVSTLCLKKKFPPLNSL